MYSAWGAAAAAASSGEGVCRRWRAGHTQALHACPQHTTDVCARDAARVPARPSLLKMAARYQKAFSIPDGFPQILKAFTREVRIRDAPF